MFKLRLLEKYQIQITKELDHVDDVESVSAIMDQLNKVNKRREVLVNLLHAVMTK